MLIHDEWESVLADYQEEQGDVDPLLALLGEQSFYLGCAFAFQVMVEAFQNKSYSTIALFKDELLSYHEQKGNENGYTH